MRRARVVACAALVALCGSAAGIAAPSVKLRNPVFVPAPSPTPIGASKSVMPAAIDAMSVAWPSPQSLRAVTGLYDCNGHLPGGSDLHTVCTNLIVAGKLVLIWTAPASAALTPSGFRIYAASAGGAVGTLVTSTADKAHTLAQMPNSSNGYAGRCYVATAMYGNHESKPSNVFCATANSTARIITLVPSHALFKWKDKDLEKHFEGFIAGSALLNSPTVGYYYWKQVSILGDQSNAVIHRYAAAFAVDSYKTKHLVLATLRLTIQQSYGKGNNYSCAATVGSGTEFWWKPDAAKWLDGDFTSAAHFGSTGPTVSANVTTLVNKVLAGAPNYGFVVRNDGENLNAFENDQCETVYGNPQLELVYFDP